MLLKLRPSCVQGPNGLQPSTWGDALAAVKEGLQGVKGTEIKAIAGKLADAESIIMLKDLVNK